MQPTAGAVSNLQLGNLLIEQTCYNDLLQPVARRLGDATSTNCAVQTSTDLLHLGFGYGTASANNGNMMQQTIWAPDNGSGSPWSVTQDYTYDAVNRLATSAEKLGGATQWSRTYSYDHFGNRWVSGATGHTLHSATPTSQSAVQASTNRLTGTGITYDNAGNLTAHPFITPGSGSMAYDAHNKMTAFTATGVSVATRYDAAGRRVRKDHNGKTTIWVYDTFGKLTSEYTMASQRDQATYFTTTDHLGSTRLVTTELGDIKARRDYFPFGESIDSTLSGRGAVVDGTLASFSASPGMRQQFTGQPRDEETGLDYFWERCFSAELGRFASADPENAGAEAGTPQLWNAYSYVGNSPLAFVDPSGRARCGSIVNNIPGAEGRTLDEAFSTSTEAGFFNAVVWAESAEDVPGVQLYNNRLPINPDDPAITTFRLEKNYIAQTIINRWHFVNNRLWIDVPHSAYKGEVYVASGRDASSWGRPGSVSNVLNSGGFEVVSNGGLTPGFKQRLTDALNSDHTSEACINLALSLWESSWVWENKMDFDFLSIGGVLPLSFNHEGRGSRTLKETHIGQFGSDNIFTGVTVDRVTWNPSGTGSPTNRLKATTPSPLRARRPVGP